MRTLFKVLLAGAAVAASASGADATPIEFTTAGVATLTVGGVTHESASFVIRAGADTANRAPILGLPAWTLDHAWATIEVAGVGTLTCVETTRTFVEQGLQIVGFSHGGEAGSDILDGPVSPLFTTWSLDRDVGPVSGPVRYYGASVMTDRGELRFGPGPGTLTFSARLIPAPMGLAVMAVASCLGGRRRRA